MSAAASAGPSIIAAPAGWVRPASATSRTEEEVAGSRLLVLAVVRAVRAAPPTKASSLVVLLSRAAGPLVLVGLVSLPLRDEENLDLSHEETLDSPFASFGVEDGPAVMVVSVLDAGIILDVTGSLCLVGLVKIVDLVVVDVSSSSFVEAILLVGSTGGSGAAAACSSVPEGVMSGTGGTSSSTTGADNTRAATSSAWSGSVTGGVIVPLGSSVEIAIVSTGNISSDMDTTTGASVDIGWTLGIGSRTGGSVAVAGLSSSGSITAFEVEGASLALRFSSSRRRLSSAFFIFSSSFLAFASCFSSSGDG